MKKLDKPLKYEDVDIHRRDECSKYTECLHLAEKYKWKSFSCQNCNEYALPIHQVSKATGKNFSPLATDMWSGDPVLLPRYWKKRYQGVL